ncbi:HlyD family type I secretion periplasmic adaptor subunit [Phreatobacter sp.]|uniref:HlyD family type I secretion periplasmic adaptor subunit n=1 Tax=Phreatobacter sp. TaxID=1966341 RepID=UPI0022C84D48|nr:HlyD family type I secretion periplasmic adaptor subunit [Phreatobacter sp.]MCZ8314966.1 HlyD family type I secretion periplasmic adaptor subunit [Phreatobacter sp.]
MTEAAPPITPGANGVEGLYRGMRRLVLVGMAVVVVFVGGIGGWAATVPLAGAVVAGGVVVVDTNVRMVQHPTGGVVGEILVRETARVQQGDLLIRLDATITRANLQVIVKQLNEAAARQARLEAERDGAANIVLPASLDGRLGDPEVARSWDSEVTLFNARRSARQGQQRQLRERIDQIREEIVGLTAQEQARRRQVELIERELGDIRDLFRRNLVPRPRVVELEREGARLAGDVGQFVSERARAEGRITEAELQILQIDQDLRREVSTELREIQARTGELVERRVAAEDALKRIDIRSPASGFVHQLSYHTVGGVITAGQPIMMIVPGNDVLVIEVRIAPQDIDKVAIGQQALIRFPALPHSTTPEVNGTVVRLSADVVRDPQTGSAFFLARLAFADGELDRLGRNRIVPGMPAEIYVKTGERTALAYLTRPLMDQVNRAFRER